MLKSWKQIGIQFLFLLALYSVIRVVYLGYNWGAFHDFDTSELFSSFLLGLRFDTSAILMMNLPFFLYWLYPSRRHRATSLKIFFFINVMFLAVNVADFELAKFNGRRLTPFFFQMAPQDLGGQIGQLIWHYWHMTLIFALMVVALVKYFPRPAKFSVKVPIYKVAFLYGVFLPVWLLGVRGGTQSRPVREANAYVFSSPKLGNLALNSSFTFIYGRKSSLSLRYEFFDDKEMQEFRKSIQPKSSEMHGRLQGSNVVLIIMESMALEYMGKINNRKGYTPFLDEFAEKSLFFKRAYANGRRSIDVIPSIMAGLPALIQEPFLLSGQQNTILMSYPRILEKMGYATHFFHSVKNGTKFLDDFTKRIGIDHYWGLNEYPDEMRKRDYDGYWGIWDGPYLEFVHSEINKIAEPFYSTIFTLSAHQPYDVPPGMEGKFAEGTQPIHRTITYADHALGEFFKSIEKEDWYHNTLFVLAADHTSLTDDPEYSGAEAEYKIPIIFYHPSFDAWPKGIDQKIIQHVDIMPTVLDLVGAEEPEIVSGRSVFSKADGFAVFQAYNNLWYRDNQGLMRMNRKGGINMTNGDTDRENFFKAYVQYIVNGVTDNNLINDIQASEARR